MRYGKLSLVVVLLLHAQLLVAETHFNSGEIKGIGGVICLLLFWLLLIVSNIKDKRAKKNIAISKLIDPFWDYEGIVSFSQDTFTQIQNARTERNADLVRDRITEELYQSFKKEWDWMKVKKEINIIDDVQINRIKIIGDEDYYENEKDTYTVFLSGRLIDYTLSERSNKIFENSKKKRSRFFTFYHFRRHEGKWLLGKIETRDLAFKIYQSKQIIQ